MKILVTGGAGFIGSNVASQIKNEGHDVTVADSLYLGKEENISEGIDFVKIDVMDKEAINNLFEEKKFDYVFHFAALSSNPMFRPSPTEGISINIVGFCNIADACKDFGVKKLIYASTSSIYSGGKVPSKEDQEVNPKIHYEVSLYSRELIAAAYKKEFGLKSVGLRYFSVYGYNEKHKEKFANLITQFIWQMKKGEKPVIYGDGNQTRDFVFVEDVAQANILAMNTEMDGIFNVGTNTSISLKEMVEIINKKLGTTIEPEYTENPLKNYIFETLADITKIKEYGYKPKVDLEKGIELLINHYD